MRDARTKLLKEGCARGTVQRSSDVATRDAQTLSSTEEYALGMVQNSSSDAAKMDVKIKLRQEECALGMGQSANNAALKDVKI